MLKVFTIIGFCLWQTTAFANGIEVRVALDLATQDAHFSAEGGLEITEAGSGVPLKTGQISDVRIKTHGQGLKINMMAFPVESIRIESPDGILYFNGKRYRGYFVLYDTGGAFMAVNHVELQDYLQSVVASEMPTAWPIEALKAQAVAARNYALHKRTLSAERNYDVEASVQDQVYKGMSAEDEKTNSAVRLTDGMTLIHENRLVQTFYHSTSGGRTENAADVFSGPGLPYLKSIFCKYDRESTYYVWQYSATFSEIQTALGRGGIRVGTIRGLSIKSRTSSGRIAELGIHTKRGKRVIKAVDFRRLMGGVKIKSTRFTMRKRGNRVTFKGRGYGHGVGLCQWGARGMAEKNFDFKKILAHYYPGTKLTHNLFVPDE